MSSDRDAIDSSLDSLFQQRRVGAAVLVSGQPGMGKTHLARRFLKRCPPRTSTIEGRGLPTGNPALLPVCRAIASYERGGVLNELDIVTQEYVQTLPLLSEYLGPALKARQRAKLGFGIDAASTPSETYTFLVLEQVLKDLGERRPLVLFLDDVHWLDASSLAFVGQLIQDLPKLPIFLLMTSRANGTAPAITAPIRELLDQCSSDTALQLRVQPLAAEETRQVVEHHLGGPLDCDDAGLDWLRQRSKGNPRFLRELVTILLERGGLTAHLGRWRLDNSSMSRVMPPSLAAMLNDRLNAVVGEDEEMEMLLQYAAVSGSTFSSKRIARAANVAARRAALLLDRLGKTTGLIERAEPPGAFRFDHDLTREAILERVPGTACELHLRIAEVCLDEGAAASEAAFHLREGGHMREAATRYLDASREAYAVWALGEAGRCAAAATDLLRACADPDVTSLREHALVAHAECLIAAERYAEVVALLRPELDCMPPSQAPRLALLLGRAAGRLPDRAAHQDGLRVLREAARSPKVHHDHDLRADLASALVYLYEAGLDHEAAHAWFLTGVEAAKMSGNPRRICRAWRLANVFWQPDRVLRVLAEARRVAERAGLKYDEALILNNMGTAAYAVHEIVRARECFDSARRGLAACGGFRTDTPMNNLGILAFVEGDFPLALRLFEEAASICRDSHVRLFIDTNRAVTHATQGDLGCAEERLRDLLSVAQADGDTYYEDCIRHNLAVVLVRSRRPIEAIEMATACPPRVVTSDGELVRGKRALLIRQANHVLCRAPDEQAERDLQVLEVSRKPQVWLYRMDWHLCDIEFWED